MTDGTIGLTLLDRHTLHDELMQTTVLRHCVLRLGPLYRLQHIVDRQRREIRIDALDCFTQTLNEQNFRPRLAFFQ